MNEPKTVHDLGPGAGFRSFVSGSNANIAKPNHRRLSPENISMSGVIAGQVPDRAHLLQCMQCSKRSCVLFCCVVRAVFSTRQQQGLFT